MLALAGVAKVRHPAPTGAALHAIGLPSHAIGVRLVGVIEIALGAAAVSGAPALAWFVAIQWGALVVVAVVLVRRPTVPCGCFGWAAPTPVTGLHVAVDLTFAAIALVVAGFGDVGLLDAGADARGGPFVVLGLVIVLAVLVRGLLTDLPALRVAMDAAPT